ncbi:hypothetical protein PoB_006431200 [Plakobranchus ocellatus]|uniref:Uncharacterized protein n=1 Tax=Plakobranchus ocellatus TaxID=259542 RepID=A0AAV4D0S0_9GAST|nr:hypothetical protein PoB_006431200 [Plakobranchus ocellatus]
MFFLSTSQEELKENDFIVIFEILLKDHNMLYISVIAVHVPLYKSRFHAPSLRLWQAAAHLGRGAGATLRAKPADAPLCQCCFSTMRNEHRTVPGEFVILKCTVSAFYVI